MSNIPNKFRSVRQTGILVPREGNFVSQEGAEMQELALEI